MWRSVGTAGTVPNHEYGLVVGWGGNFHIVQVHPLPPGSMAQARPFARPVSQDMLHRLSCGSEKVAAVSKVLRAQAQPGLVHQGRRLQRLPNDT